MAGPLSVARKPRVRESCVREPCTSAVMARCWSSGRPRHLLGRISASCCQICPCR